jgi:hypothetical protein
MYENYSSFDDFALEYSDPDDLNFAIKVCIYSTGVELIVAQPRKERVKVITIEDPFAMHQLGSYLRKSLLIMAENFVETIAFVEQKK